jgi:hypothetical protein
MDGTCGNPGGRGRSLTLDGLLQWYLSLESRGVRSGAESGEALRNGGHYVSAGLTLRLYCVTECLCSYKRARLSYSKVRLEVGVKDGQMVESQ